MNVRNIIIMPGRALRYFVGFVGRLFLNIARFSHRYTKKIVLFIHHLTAKRPHLFFMERVEWYKNWHSWQHHGKLHFSVLVVYVVAVLGVLLTSYRVAFAADLNNTWDFLTSSDYSFGDDLETSGSSVRMKAQNYADDLNTMALYHLDESSGTTADDASSNNNDGTVTSENWQTGSLNNALSLNGTSSRISVPDSAALSLSQSNTIEAWTKFGSSFSAGSHTQRQTIADKGEYQLYYDNETGKVTYELANGSASGWTKVAGDDVNDSWNWDGMLGVTASVVVGSDVYAGLGIATKDAEVWKYSSGTWTKVGGDGVHSSWSGEHEYVLSMETDGTNVYAGLGTSAGDAEVWRFNGTGWSKIGGDTTTPGQWGIGTHEGVYSLDYFGGNLYAGLGASANDAEVWRWNGSAWTKIGGDSTNSGWTTNYDYVYSMANDGTNLYVGLGATAGEAEVWRWNGTIWAKLADSGSGFGTNLEFVRSLYHDGTYLYAGTGDTAGDADLYRCTTCEGTPSWSQIGGDGISGSWTTNYEYVHSITSDGSNIIAGLGASDGDGEVYSWNGTTWTKIGGDGVNSSWAGIDGDIVFTLSNNGSTVYAGTYNSAGTGMMYSWNGSAWTRIGGNGVNNSWGFYNLQSVEVMQWSGDYLYAGTGYTVAGNAMIWRFDGSSWSLIGGQGVNSSWSAFTYETVSSMASLNGKLYVGLGYTAGDSEVWEWDGSTWTQIGGTASGNWGTSAHEMVTSMAVIGGKLYAGLGTGAGDAEVWEWSGSSTNWSQIGGTASGNWTASNYDRVQSMAVYDGKLYAGLGVSTNESEVWEWSGSGTAWTKVGGDGVSSSWNTNYETIRAMTGFGNKLVVGLGDGTGDAEVWTYDGSTWELIGGGAGSVNGSWSAGTYEYIPTMTVYNGKLYAGLGYTPNGDGELWEFNGTDDWTQIGGDTLNNGWDSNVEEVKALSVYKGKLYVGNGNSGNTEDPSIWSWGNNGFVQSSTTSFDTNWHHIAATYNGSTMKIYIDGSEVGSQSTSLSMPDSSRSLYLGTSWGGREQGKARGYFEGMLDEIRISNIARSTFTTKPYSNTVLNISLNEPARQSGVWHWDTFESDETLNGGTILFRLSVDDGDSWLYWDGDAWETSESTSEANPSTVIDTNISTLPVTFDGLRWEAILQGDGNQRVTLNEVTATATSDIVDPSANASSITALKANGGSSLGSGEWTNGLSPYFSWTAGSDADSGIKGYCLYLGTDDSADPVTTKGLLGNSPAETGGLCQFLVTGTSIDTATAGYIETPLSTSNSSYYLLIKAIDNSGNIINTAEQFAFKFDNTVPTNPSYVTAPSGFINTKEVTLTWPTTGGSSPSDSNSGLAGLQYRIGSNSWYGDSHSGTGNSSDLLTNDGSYTTIPSPDFDDLEEGVNTIYFRTWDAAGNVSSSYTTAIVKINTTGAPSEPQNVEANPTSNTTNSFAFDWDAPATFVGDVDNLTYCYTINSAPTSNNCNFTSSGVTSLGAGPYATQPGENTFYVVARDESSNINYDNYATTTFTANTPSPGISENLDIVDVSIKATSNWRLAITWNEPTDTGAGIASYKIYRSTDNSTFSQVGSSSSTTYIDAGLTQQRYYYRIKACDSTNNCGADSSVVNEIPTGKFTTAATLVADPEVSEITTKRATVSWSTDRASDSKVAIGTSSGEYSPSEVAISAQVSAHEIELDNLSAGTTYYCVAKWTDEDGNTGTSQEFSFTTSPAPSLKEVTVSRIGLTTATISFTSKEATKVSILYGKGESYGGINTVNTSLTESTYSVELEGLDDGTKYFYKLLTYDNEDSSYESSVFSFTTPERPRINDLRFQPIVGEPTSTQMVTWTTNVPANSLVTYGKVGTSGTESQNLDQTTDHEIIIRNLEDDSDYFLVAQSRDEGGNVAVSDKQLFHTALDTRPPKILEISIESAIRGTGAEARGQVVVSWKTDEPATSQVGYAEGSEATNYNNKTAEDTQLTTEHIVIVSDLPTSRVYSLAPISKDKAGNTGTGESQSAIVGRASDSVLTIILNTLKQVFGL